MTNDLLLRPAATSHTVRDWWRRLFGFEPAQALRWEAPSFGRGGRPADVQPDGPPARNVRLELLEACAAIRLAEYDRALELLSTIEPDRGAAHAACYHNVLGVIHEARHEWRKARKCYGRAMSADKRFAPAQQNMRRLYELWAFGRSHERVLLGDEMADVWLARLPETAERI